MNITIIGTGDARDFSTFRRLKLEEKDENSSVVMFTLSSSQPATVQEGGIYYPKTTNAVIKLCENFSIECLIVLNTNIIFSSTMSALYNIGIKIYGPTESAIPLEMNKIFGKKIMYEAGIKTPSFRDFSLTDDLHSQLPNLMQGASKWVIKSDFMLKDANVRTCLVETVEQAQEAIALIKNEATYEGLSTRVLLEEYVQGAELSVHVLLTPEGYTLLPPVRDYKKRQLMDREMNTHGLGAICSTCFPPDIQMEIQKEIVDPLFKTLQKRGLVFTGILYLGIILTETGTQLLEINVRPGNPEWLSILPLIKSSFLSHIQGSILGKSVPVHFYPDSVALARFVVTARYPLKDNATTIVIPQDYASQARNLMLEINPENIRMETEGIYAIEDRALCLSIRGENFVEIAKTMEKYIKYNFPVDVYSDKKVGFDYYHEYLA